MDSVLEKQRQQWDALVEEVRRLETMRPEAARPQSWEAILHVTRLRVHIAWGRVRALEAGVHPNKPCGEPRFGS